MEIGVKTGGTASGAVPIGQAEILPNESGTPQKQTEPLLPEPSVNVTEKSPAAQIIDGYFESATETAKNLVDSPEVRRKKAADRAYAARQEAIRDAADVRAEARAERQAESAARVTEAARASGALDDEIFLRKESKV